MKSLVLPAYSSQQTHTPLVCCLRRDKGFDWVPGLEVGHYHLSVANQHERLSNLAVKPFLSGKSSEMGLEEFNSYQINVKILISSK